MPNELLTQSADNLTSEEIEAAKPLDHEVTEDKSEEKEIKHEEKSEEIAPKPRDISEDLQKVIINAAKQEKAIKKLDESDQGVYDELDPEYQERGHENNSSFGFVYVLVGAALLGGAYAILRKRKPSIQAAGEGTYNTTHYEVPKVIDGEGFAI